MTHMNDPNLLSIVTTYNPNFDHLDVLINCIDLMAKKLEYHFEVIIIDDFNRVTAKENQIDTDLVNTRIIHHTNRIGQTASLVEGMMIAKGIKIIVMDSDMIENVPDIARFIAASKSSRLVLGNRANRIKESPLRFFISALLTKIFSMVHNNKVSDYSTPMFLIDTSVIKELKIADQNPAFVKKQIINFCRNSKTEIDIFISNGHHKSTYGALNLAILAIKEITHILRRNPPKN